jgi:hypothetical protein
MLTADLNSADTSSLDNPLSKAPSIVDWVQTIELGYDEPSPLTKVCFSCGEKPVDGDQKQLSKCAKCEVAAYCGRDCQTNDWKNGGHKRACASYKRLSSLNTTESSDDTKETIRNEVYQRIRFYACPYAVFRTAELGNGFLFVQSDTTLKDLSIGIPKDTTGRQLTRSVLLHYLTLGEYDAEVCRDDFEMAMVRSKLQSLVEEYDAEKEVVLLMRLRCGHVAVGKAVLVPDYLICKQLGNDYYASNPAGAVQLNLDDL